MAEEKLEKINSKDFVYAVGRRKAAVARVRLYKTVKAGLLWGEEKIEKGKILVNEKPVGNYFSGGIMESFYKEPFLATNTLDKYAVTIRVMGGGLKGQLDAAMLGISRALSEIDKEKFRPILKKKGLLTRDARVRERRKVGTGGKARRKKQSPKR
ncbi:MAG: 30S ribosomal protein S9 [Candidatus Levybacteria bacterium]|nr:30S ribosomal protein S9 [Candidatus Levybacteria bacterium]